MDWLSVFGVSSGVIASIVGLVQLIKYLLKEKISQMVEGDKKKLDKVWLVVVAVLSIAGAAGVVAVQGWSWAAFALACPAYFVGAVGVYVTGKKIIPIEEKD